MNENLNLVKILKDCPKGTPLYSTIHGNVNFIGIDDKEITYPIEIEVSDKDGCLETESYTSHGRFYHNYNGECALFPSEEQRDWSKFKVKKPKFDPKTLQPFDKVLVRDGSFPWRCDIFSYYQRNKRITCHCTSDDYIYDRCIPYNEETKHLVGTNDEAPEFYRYWEKEC